VGFVEGMRKAWVLVSLTIRYTLSTRRGFAIAGLAAVPVILALSLAVANVPAFDIVLYQILMVPLFLQVVLIFVTIVPSTALVREEIEDNTIPYLLTRPVSKPAIAGWKYAGYLATAVALLLPPLAISYAITQLSAGDPLSSDLDVLYAFSLAAVLGAAAYGAFFLFLSLLVRRPLAVGLLFGFVWESIVSLLPGNVPLLSIIHYLKSIIKGIVPLGPLAGYPTDLSALQASAVLIAFAVGTMVVSMIFIQNMEFKQKA